MNGTIWTNTSPWTDGMITAYLTALLVMSLGTYLARSLPMAFTSRKALPPGLVRWLDSVAPAVLGALLGPALFAPGGQLLPPWQNPALLAALPAAVVALKKRNLALTLVVGVGAYTILITVVRD